MNFNKTNTVAFFLISAFFLLGYKFKRGEKTVVKGDLAFEKISFSSFYGASDSQYLDLSKQMDQALASPDSLDEHELYLWRYFDKLRGYGLLRKPYLILRKEDSSQLAIHLSEDEYEKVKNLQHRDLVEDSSKVTLTLEVEALDSMIYYSDKILELKVVDGQTFPDRKAVDWF
jgi:hypothetical protein